MLWMFSVHVAVFVVVVFSVVAVSVVVMMAVSCCCRLLLGCCRLPRFCSLLLTLWPLAGILLVLPFWSLLLLLLLPVLSLVVWLGLFAFS